MDPILSTSEIKSVLHKAKDPIYKIPGSIVFFGRNHPLDILKITPKGLIFISGNGHTGFKHICERHNYYSDRNDWIEFKDPDGNIIEKKGKHGNLLKNLDNPSKFNPYSIPIIDYLKIADEIFCDENYCPDKNKEKDLFNLYIGLSKSSNNIKYRLLTYKHTKIVHTLFPDAKKSKKKKIINYSRGEVVAFEMLDESSIISIELPYYDYNRIERYKIIIRRYQDTGLEKFYIQKNKVTGQPFFVRFIGERETSVKTQITSYLMEMQFYDFSFVEREIKKLDDLK